MHRTSANSLPLCSYCDDSLSSFIWASDEFNRLWGGFRSCLTSLLQFLSSAAVFYGTVTNIWVRIILWHLIPGLLILRSGVRKTLWESGLSQKCVGLGIIVLLLETLFVIVCCFLVCSGVPISSRNRQNRFETRVCSSQCWREGACCGRNCCCAKVDELARREV